MDEAEHLRMRLDKLEEEVKELRFLIETNKQYTIQPQKTTRSFNKDNTFSRYYNPPLEIKTIGRELPKGEFDNLSKHLNDNEVIIGLYMNKNLNDIASHIHNQDRLNEIYETCLKEKDGTYAPISFFAVNKASANAKMDNKIP